MRYDCDFLWARAALAKLRYRKYDGTLYPPLETIPRRFAISHRNRWMVDAAGVGVACVLHD